MKPACEVTHPQILAGICPWCEQPVGDRSIVPDAVRVWNIPAMSAALDDADDRVRQMTVSNLMHDGPSPEEAVPLLFKALNDACERTRSTAGHALSHLGRKLSAADIGRLESQMANSPHELAIRIAALGYFFRGNRESGAARRCQGVSRTRGVGTTSASDSSGIPKRGEFRRSQRGRRWEPPALDPQAPGACQGRLRCG